MKRTFGCVLFASLLLCGQYASLRKLEAEMARVAAVGGGAVPDCEHV